MPNEPHLTALQNDPARVAVVGGGPAGLMAAELLLSGGLTVDLFDAMPSPGRKFLLAGKGGLNLTHSEALPAFTQRYRERAPEVGAWLQGFGPQALREWAAGLGVETFVGSSGRVFPSSLKAAPLLRAWLHRLRAQGLRVHVRHRLDGLGHDGTLKLTNPHGSLALRPAATVLALGGASWPQLGSDGAWVPWLQTCGADVAPLHSANCGFEVAGGWSAYLSERFAGQPVKPVRAALPGGAMVQGEFVLTATGVEGSLVYTFAAELSEAIARDGHATWLLDLLPSHSPERVAQELAHGRGSRSLATHLKSRLGISGLKLALLHELLGTQGMADAAGLAAALKALPLRLNAPRPLAEAISTAGGVRLESLDAQLMLRSVPGVFCAGEMLDWSAPTGGYLLTAAMASGRLAGKGALAWVQARGTRPATG